jgi:hypothetical protein
MKGRITVILIVLMFGLTPLAQVGGSGGQDEDRAVGPFLTSSVWTDPLDDLSHAIDGWIASSVISARPGMRYDYVHFDAHTPGNSHINITVMNASAESLEVGFANKTIDEFKLKGGSYLSMFPMDHEEYPDIRIQANLVADGADRPVLYAWSLYFLDEEAWRDDFLWPGRMEDHRGINFTGGDLEVNLTTMGGGGSGGDYEEFPPIVGSGEYGGPDVYYVNAAGDGYDDRTEIGMGGWGLLRPAVPDVGGPVGDPLG